MLLVVPVEEAAAEGLGVLDGAEALWELRLVLHGFEVAFRERIVVGGMRAAVRFGDAESASRRAVALALMGGRGRHAGSVGRAAPDACRGILERP